MGCSSKQHVKDLKGKAFDIAVLLDYQNDAIVSREIIKKDTGTVTLFAFDNGQGLSEHTAPFDALVYIVDGSVEVIISGKSNKLKTGEMIIMPANKPHALKAIKRFKMLLVMIKT
jgi:quercetin dioxygenase-like cupin family protein